MDIPPLSASVESSLLRLGKTVLNLEARSHVMGILNVTPDSFADGGRYLSPDAAVEHGLRLADEGADIIDIGGESTRPRGGVYGDGASEVDVHQECARILPVIERLCRNTDVPISVDTWKASVAEAALRAGAVMVNDISGFHFDADMPGVVARAGAAAVLMHTPGKPWNMPGKTAYQDLLGDIAAYLAEGLRWGRQAGVAQMVVDPGFGFGKSSEENLRLLQNLGKFLQLGVPVLVGVSRKSFIGTILDLPVEDRLEGSLAAAVVAVVNGARIVRSHDVRATRRALAVADAILHA